jgi:hypothetical protein
VSLPILLTGVLSAWALVKTLQADHPLD